MELDKINSTISKRSAENSPPAETKKAEKPEEKEKLKQDPAQNKTLEASQNKTVGQNEMKPEPPNPPQNKTEIPPKTEKEDENLPKLVLTTEIPNSTLNSSVAPENATKAKIENRGLENLKLKRANEREDLPPDDEGFGDSEKKFSEETPEKDDHFYETSTPPIGQQKSQEIAEMINPSDQTGYSGSSGVFEEAYYPLVNFVLILWLIVHMFPKAKRFFNWIQKSLTNADRNARKRKKQKN